MNSTPHLRFLLAISMLAIVTPRAWAASDEDLASELQNPVANLISVPFQNNFDFKAGPSLDGWRYTLNFQPVIPIKLNDDILVITRTIVPLVYQNDIVTDGSTGQVGLGDTSQSFFFSSTKVGADGIIFGAGPAFVWPSATNDATGQGHFGLGPTAVLLQQNHGFTYGILANHIWSYAGDNDRASVDATFLQPFLSYTWTSGFSLGINTEASYDWHASQWTIPINLTASQVTRIGNQPMSFGIGGRYFAEGPSGTPEWGIRLTMTFLFPQ